MRPGPVPGCLLLLLLALPAAPARAGGDPVPSRPLRVLTLNVLHGGVLSGLGGDAQQLGERFEIVVEALRLLDPDVVGLQEASVGRERGHVAERLAARLGFHHAHAPASFRIFPAGWANRLVGALLNFAEGPAILSRFPIAAWEAQELPRCGRPFETRLVLHAALDTPWGRLPAFSTHTSGDPCHTRPVAEFVAARRAALPGVLMGDFNAVEDSPAIAVLTGEAGFVDAFRAANPTAPGFTVWQRVSEPTRMARRRVDYLFLVPGTGVRGRVGASRVVLDAPRRLPDGRVLWPSDHYGVLAEVEVTPGEAR